MSEGNSDRGPDSAQRAEVYCKLADRARDRFESIRNLQWKVNFGVWTVLAVGIGGVIASNWAPTIAELVGATIAACLGGWLYRRWLLYSQEVHQRDNRCSYWWETHVRRIIGDTRFPDQLAPTGGNEDASERWHSAFDLDNEEDPDLWNRQVNILPLHRTHRDQFWTTILLAALLLLAIGFKCYSCHSQAYAQTPRMTIEGAPIEASTLKVGGQQSPSKP